jgi:fructokinase
MSRSNVALFPIAVSSLQRSDSCVPILIIGEALLDCFPDAKVAGGAPFNVARTLAALHLAPVMITRISTDENGRKLRTEFDRFGLSTDGLQYDDQLATGYVDIHFDDANHHFNIAENVAWDAMCETAALAVTKKCAPRIVCFGTLAQRSLPSQAAIAAVLEEAKNNGALRILDLNLRVCADQTNARMRVITEWSLRHADIVKVNDDELRQLLIWFVSDCATDTAAWDSPIFTEALRKLLRRFPLQQLIVTRGGNGYAVFDGSGILVASGTSPKTALIDTVGAGDAFTAIVILGHSLNWPLALSFERANYFAAAICGVCGAVADEPNFYKRWARQWNLLEPALRYGAAPQLLNCQN